MNQDLRLTPQALFDRSCWGSESNYFPISIMAFLRLFQFPVEQVGDFLPPAH
jgi:hypothetical protein